MKNYSIRIVILGLIAITAFSCESDDYLEPSRGTAFGIRHDRSLAEYESIAASSSSDLPDFSAVVSFSYSLDGSDNHDYVASGTLIESNWILTAAHNFYDSESQDAPAPSSGVIVKVGSDPNNPIGEYTVSNIILHPSWLNGDQDYSDANDLCLVKLSTPISNLTPAPIHFSNAEQIGTKVWFSGYGDYSREEGQNPDLLSKRHAIENTLDRVKSGLTTNIGVVTYSGGLLAFDFDDPEGMINALGDDTVNEDEGILGAGSSDSNALELEGATVQGDSGGPLFIKNGSTWEVAGVLSGGADEPTFDHQDGDYGDISIFTSVSTSYNWILSVIQ